MRLHANAALSLTQRRRMMVRVVEHGWSLTKAAEAAEVSDRTCSKWVRRYRAEGAAGLADRSSAPRSIPHRTSPQRVAAIASLRRLRMTSTEIAEVLAMPRSTVSAVLKRIGLGKLSRLDPLDGQALAAGSARAGQPLSAPARGRAAAYRHQEARPDP